MTVVIDHELDLGVLEPIKGTLLDVAQVSDNENHVQLDGVFDTINCVTMEATTAVCPATPHTSVVPSQASTWEDAFQFGIWGGVKCKLWDDAEAAEMAARVRQVWDLRESIPIERGLMQTRFVASAGHWAAATDLTPGGGAVTPKVGLAMLEEDASEKYAGAPTFHMPRTIASLLSSLAMVKVDGQQLRTSLGSKVAAGGGYGNPNNSPVGAAPAAGEVWIYASGEVRIARGKYLPFDILDRETNERLIGAQKIINAAVDCYVSAIRVKVE